jgi:translation initiation factor 4E
MSQKQEEEQRRLSDEENQDDGDHDDGEDKGNQENDRNVDLDVKHPLQNTWTLWYDNPSRKTNAITYESFLKRVHTFDTVEGFWSVYNHIKRASTIPNGGNYRLFKAEIEPKWEDPNNKNGGSIVVAFKLNSPTELDNKWLYLQLACIGENFTDGDAINGVNVSIRKGGQRFEIWVKDYKDDEVNKRIASELRDVLELAPNQPEITFKAHYQGYTWTL